MTLTSPALPSGKRGSRWEYQTHTNTPTQPHTVLDGAAPQRGRLHGHGARVLPGFLHPFGTDSCSFPKAPTGETNPKTSSKADVLGKCSNHEGVAPAGSGGVASPGPFQRPRKGFKKVACPCLGFLMFIHETMRYGIHSQELSGRNSTGANGDQRAVSPGHREKSDCTRSQFRTRCPRCH